MLVNSFIRFLDDQGAIVYGEPSSSLSKNLEGTTAAVLEGDPFSGFSRTGTEAKVKQILCPLEFTPAILCIGLNYRKHVEEAKLSVPKYPSLFTKPPDALTGPGTVRIHPDLQKQLDYEGELTVVIGKTAKNVEEKDALDYVLGYTNGNDLTCRYYQLPENSGGQFGYSKSFDNFAPIGPAIVTRQAIPDPQKLHYELKVNGQVRQSTGTDDQIASVAKVIAHLSRATSLRPGTVIMTGTPAGVGYFMEPKGFLRNGDEVTVESKELGILRTKIAFD